MWGDGWWRVSPAIGYKGARASLYRLGAEMFIDRLLLAWARARAEASDADWRTLVRESEVTSGFVVVLRSLSSLLSSFC